MGVIKVSNSKSDLQGYLSCTNSESQMLVENRQFEPTPCLFSTPVGGNPLEFRGYFCHQKTNRVLGLSYDVVCVILCLAILVQHRLVTDIL